MPDVDEVTIERNKRELEKIRSERRGGESNGDGGLTEDRIGSLGADAGRNTYTAPGDARGTQGTGEIDGPAKGNGKRVRPADRKNVNTAKSAEHPDPEVRERVKRPFWQAQEKPPVQLLSDKEVQDDEQKAHLMVVYMFLWSLPDYVLEIIVKDHEEVQIWQLAEVEAEELAETKLRLAKTDKDTAREVRALLSVYDRMFYYTLILPRLLATGKHIKEHEGLSLR